MIRLTPANIQMDVRIAFTKDPNIKKEKRRLQSPYLYYPYQKQNTKSLCLMNTDYPVELFELIPKQFTIISNNNIPYKFNTQILKETSLLISKLLNENPDCLEYHLNFNDEHNVLEKIEKMYKCEEVTLDSKEYLDLFTIAKKLELIQNQNFYKYHFSTNKKEINFGIDLSIFTDYLQMEAPKTFTIKTNKKEYKCNMFGIYSSKKISSLLSNDPKIDCFVYDFDDELDEFQLICDLFNFKEIKVTSNNMNSLHEMITDLEITKFVDKINEFVEDYEKVSQTIDDDQNIVDSIEEIFDWLYKIKELNVETVKHFIIESNWVQTDENVQELVAILLQVINSDSTYHSYILNLIIQLDKESNEMNSLQILIPFIIQKLMLSFGETLTNCSFVYNLYKIGLIQKIELNKQFIKIFIQEEKKRKMGSTYLDSYDSNKDANKLNNLISWFYPELIEIPEIKEKNILKQGSICYNFINLYLPNNIDKYKIMRDSGEPDDELTKALRNDDVDTLQSIIIKNDLLTDNKPVKKNFYSILIQKNLSNAFIPYNIYENFVPNGMSNYIDYSCAYGSLKCFKYLLLNHAQITELTFDCAVFGGNIEIIKIVDQNIKKPSPNKGKNRGAYTYNYMPKVDSINLKFPSIIKHQNNVFDWILQEKYRDKSTDDNIIGKLLVCAAFNGNAHALIEIIDKGYNFMCNSHEIIRSSSRNGFYLFTRLFTNIIKSKKKDLYLDYSSSVYFGNLSLFKLYHENMKSRYDLKSAIALAIEFNYTNIIQYFFEELIKGNVQISQDFVFVCLKSSISINRNDTFNYLIEQFKKANPNIFKDFPNLNQLLSISCLNGNYEISKIITNLIIDDDKKEDFTTPFFNACISKSYEICKFLIEKNLFINYENLSFQVTKLSSITEEIFSLIIENADSESKEIFLNSYLEQAIMNNNKGLIKYLIKNGANCENSLFNAVESHDVELVNIILEKQNKPSFINKRSSKGTVLYIAVSYNDYELVKRLLSIPGINPSIFEEGNKTPLILSVYNMNLEIINEILDFYGDSISKETKQLDESIKILLKNFCSDNENESKYYKKNMHRWGCYVSNIPKIINVNNNNNNQDKQKYISVLKRLLEIKSIDPNCQFDDNITILYYACEKNEIEIVKLLLNLDKIDVNICSLVTGNTPLLIAIKNNNLEIAELLINFPKTNVNIKNYMGQSALTLSVSKCIESIVYLIVNNENFDPEESCIDYAFFNSSENISKMLISSKFLDVNYEENHKIDKENDKQCLRNIHELQKARLNYFKPEEKRSYITTLIDAIDKNYINKVELIINHPSFNRAKSQLKRSIFISAEKNRLEIFQKLIKLIKDDVNIFNCNNESLLFVAVKSKSKDIIKEILNNPNFDTVKSCLFDSFIETIVNNNEESSDIIKEIYNYDKDHDHFIDFTKLLPNGRSFFTLIASNTLFINDDEINSDNFVPTNQDLKNIEKMAAFFLEHDVDPNTLDKDGYSPLEYAILLNSFEFVSVLINSNKIDFSQKVTYKEGSFRIYDIQYGDSLQASDSKCKNYLLFAARSINENILREFIDKKFIDINSTDEMGETVLMEACRFNKIKNIELLSHVDDLDYLHVNNEGLDALSIVLSLTDNEEEIPEIKSKEDYFNTLITLLDQFNHLGDDSSERLDSDDDDDDDDDEEDGEDDEYFSSDYY